MVAGAADDLPEGDEAQDAEAGDGEVDEDEVAFFERQAAHCRLAKAVDADQGKQREDAAYQDDAGAAGVEVAGGGGHVWVRSGLHTGGALRCMYSGINLK